VVDLLAQRVADEQAAGEQHGEAVDRRDLHGEPRVVDEVGQGPALLEEIEAALRQLLDHGAERRGGALKPQILDAGPVLLQGLPRQVDPIDIAKILAAILQVVDHLEGGADRVRGGPGAARILAVDVEDEAADRHRRVAAVMREFVPVLVARLVRVHPERVEEFQRVARRQPALGERAAQRGGFRIVGTLAGQRVGEAVEERDLLLRRQAGIVGDVVAGPDEVVEVEDRAAVARMDQVRGDRKILVAVPLAGARLGGGGHRMYPA
jgi:hypothetical protein